jgi:toxin ParE1/3/4
MPRFRIAQPAQRDLADILTTSAERWGTDGRRRYAHLLAAAMRAVAANPEGPLTQPRNEVAPGLRSFHVRHARAAQASVKKPVHVLYYRAILPGVIEIVRVLHERMEPSRHFRKVLRVSRARKSAIRRKKTSTDAEFSWRVITQNVSKRILHQKRAAKTAHPQCC